MIAREAVGEVGEAEVEEGVVEEADQFSVDGSLVQKLIQVLILI